MDEDDLEKLREERAKELQEQEQQDQQEQVKNLAEQHLTSEARSRLANIRAARPQQASMIEAQIAKLGMSGAIQDKIDDSTLKQMLKDLSQKDSDMNIKYR